MAIAHDRARSSTNTSASWLQSTLIGVRIDTTVVHAATTIVLVGVIRIEIVTKLFYER